MGLKQMSDICVRQVFNGLTEPRGRIRPDKWLQTAWQMR
jgi:hypothetical protein